MEGGRFIDIPDIRDEKVQEELLKDRLCPFPDVENSVLMPDEMLARREFTPEITEIARRNWAKHGYTPVEIEELLNQKPQKR